MQVLTVLENFGPQIEQELHLVLEQCESPLYTLMSYQLGWVDEFGAPSSVGIDSRLYPQLCLLAANVVGGDTKQALPAAASVELVHNFSLVHDDIRNGATERYHRPTVWWVWGPSQAINVGDGLHAMGRLAIFRLADCGISQERIIEVLQKLDRSCLELCEGQHLDLTYQERLEVSEEEYFRMAKGKTGALFACSLELGALVGSGNHQIANTLGQAGRQLGIAFQIYGDIRNLWPKEEADRIASGDVLNKRKNLPVIYGLSHATGSLKRELGNMYFKRVLEPQDAVRVAQLLDELGAREYALNTATRFVQEAMEVIRTEGLSNEQSMVFEEALRLLVPWH